MWDLLDVIGDVPMDGYCGPRYWQWETEVAEPALNDRGYGDIRWTTGEHDSFGPLSRVCTAVKDGETVRFVYG